MESKILEIRKCLDSELYQAALALSLSLPDICGQIEYPTLSVRKRYEKWVETYVDKKQLGNDLEHWKSVPVDESVTGGERFPIFTPKNLYELRCSFLHSGNDEISSEFLDEFVLVKPDSDRLKDIDGSVSAYVSNIRMSEEGNKFSFTINIQYLCELICESVEKYMKDRDQSAFLDHIISLL